MADPKRIITPEHFKVAPEILGMPLASPSRRAYAMLIDLILVGILVKSGGVFLGIAAAFVLFHASSRKQPGGSFIRRSVQTTLRITGAVVLFVVIVTAWGSIRDRLGDVDLEPSVDTAVDSTGASELELNISPRDLPALAGSLIAISRAEDSAAVGDAATKILRTARRAGASPDELRNARDDLVEMMGTNADSSEIRAIHAAVYDVAGTDAPVDTRVAAVYLEAMNSNDTVAAAAYRDTLKTVIAGSEIDRLEARATRFEEQRDSLSSELEEAQKAHGIRYFISGAADDLGVGFGWSAVFFTTFLALWRGQTPGKKVAGVRVLRLDGKPIGWWIAFERFGGYAASLSVGLLGFIQILWDRNRQGLHDKACETVVVFDKKPAVR